MGCNANCDQGRRCDCAPNYQSHLGQRILRWLIRFDIWVMRTFLNGKEYETISAAAWNARLTGKVWGWTYLPINALFYFWQKDHCRMAWLWQRHIYEREPV